MQDPLDVIRQLSPLGAIAIFAWGVYQFYRASELSFRKPYWEKLLQLYESATSCVALLATTESEESWNEAKEEFWKLYYGPLCLVENRGVESAMVKFGGALKEASFERRDWKTLGGLALDVSHACRASLREDWSVPLGELPRESGSQ